MTKITIGARGSKLSIAYVEKVKELLIQRNKDLNRENIYFKAIKIGLKSKLIYIVNFLIFLQIISVIIMYYLHFPFTSQPIHLLISTLIIGIQFYFLLLYNISNNAIKI